MERLYVGNLPYVAQREDVERLFADNNIPITNIDISIDPFTGRNTSYCFVDLSIEATSAAMEGLQGQLVRGRPVKVNAHTKRSERRPRRDVRLYDDWRIPQHMRPPRPAGDAFVFDLWNRRDAQDHWVQPREEDRRLFVGGLPRLHNQAVTDSEMKCLFKGWRIEAVSKLIKPNWDDRKDPDFGSNCYCFVDFPSAEEAQAAARALNGKPTRFGTKYKIKPANKNTVIKVMREQLGVSEPAQESGAM